GILYAGAEYNSEGKVDIVTIPTSFDVKVKTGFFRKVCAFCRRGNMLLLNGRDIIARDIWRFQELPFHQYRGQKRWRVCGGRASGQALHLSWVPERGRDS